MKNTNLPVLIIHDDDLDGWASRYAAYKKFGSEADYAYLGHESDQDSVDWGLIPEQPHKIYLLDYNWPLESLFEIAETHELTVIDHHSSFAETVDQHGEYRAQTPVEMSLGEEPTVKFMNQEPYDPDRDVSFRYLFSDDNAACVLTWQDLFKKEPPKLLRHVEDMDLWNWEMEFTDEIITALYTLGPDIHAFKNFVGNTSDLLDIGVHLVDQRYKLVQSICENIEIRDAEIQGTSYTLGIVNASTFRSYVGDYVLDVHPDVDIAVIFRIEDFSGEQDVRFSLRSREEGPNVGALAKQSGGGGHEEAAGFTASALVTLNRNHAGWCGLLEELPAFDEVEFEEDREPQFNG